MNESLKRPLFLVLSLGNSSTGQVVARLRELRLEAIDTLVTHQWTPD